MSLANESQDKYAAEQFDILNPPDPRRLRDESIICNGVRSALYTRWVNVRDNVVMIRRKGEFYVAVPAAYNDNQLVAFRDGCVDMFPVDECQLIAKMIYDNGQVRDRDDIDPTRIGGDVWFGEGDWAGENCQAVITSNGNECYATGHFGIKRTSKLRPPWRLLGKLRPYFGEEVNAVFATVTKPS